MRHGRRDRSAARTGTARDRGVSVKDEAEAGAAGIAGRRELAAVVAAHRVRAAEVEVQPVEAHQLLAPALQLLQLRRAGDRPRSRAGRPRRAPAGRTPPASIGMPCSTTFTITCVIAERSRFDPLEPTTSRTAPSRSSSVGACMLVSRWPGRRWRPAARSSSPIMLFRCSPVPGHDHARVAAVRRRERGRVALTVDHRDVRRAAIAGQRGHAATARRAAPARSHAAPPAPAPATAGAPPARRGAAAARSARRAADPPPASTPPAPAAHPPAPRRAAGANGSSTASM